MGRLGYVVVCALSSLGCDLLFPALNPSSSSGGTNSSSSGALPNEPVPGEAGPTAQARTDMTLTTPVTAAVLLEGGLLLTADATMLTLTAVDGSVAPRSFAHQLGALTHAVSLDSGVLCLGTSGAQVITPDGLVDSPLARQLDVTAVRGAHVVGGELWLHLVDRLVRIRGSQARDVVVPGVDLENATVMAGGGFQDAGAVWILAAGTLYAVQSTGDGGVGAWRVRGDLTAHTLALDDAGNVMLVDASGDLHVRAPQGTWSWLRLDAAVETARSSGASGEVWLRVGGQWRIFSEGRFRPVTGIPDGTLTGLGAGGLALFLQDGGVAVARVRRRVTLSGVPADGTLREAVSVAVSSEDPGEIRRVKAQVDDNPEQDVLLPNPAFTLNPNALGVGPHTVRVTVGFRQDALSATTVFRVQVVEVRDPTWTLDIQPLFQERCNRCHGVRGSAHRMETRAIWQEEITDILAALRAGRMPLNSNALSAGEIALIEQWSTVGFPE